MEQLRQLERHSEEGAGRLLAFLQGHLSFLKLILSHARVSGRVRGRSDAQVAIQQACGGLDFLRAQGLVHNDVKPDNIFLKEESAQCAPFRFKAGARIQ